MAKSNTQHDPLISKEEARTGWLGGVSPGLLDKMDRTGELPFVRVGRRVFYRRSDLASYIAGLSGTRRRAGAA